MTRVLLCTGKGGVGKTTIAAASALRAAADGHRVLVTSTDPAHSLADAFDVPLGDQVVSVAPGLDAQQLDAQQRLERHWREIRDYVVELLSWGGIGEVQAQELALVPGLDELFALIDLADHVDSGKYDVIVVDCAPTAETLRLLALPDALRWYVERIVQPGRKFARAVRPIASRVGSVPVPDDEVFGAVESLHVKLMRVHALLQDTAATSVRLVVNPERMVIAEAMRTATSLALFGYGIDAVLVNRVLPDAITDPYLAAWQERHATHLATIRDTFAPTPVLTAPLFDDELVGCEGLDRLGAVLWADHDVTAVLHRGLLLDVEPTGEGFLMRLALPFVAKDDLDLHRRGTDLHVRAGSQKRTVPLPAALRGMDVAGARLRDGRLEVRFRAPVAAS